MTIQTTPDPQARAWVRCPSTKDGLQCWHSAAHIGMGPHAAYSDTMDNIVYWEQDASAPVAPDAQEDGLAPYLSRYNDARNARQEAWRAYTRALDAENVASLKYHQAKERIK